MPRAVDLGDWRHYDPHKCSPRGCAGARGAGKEVPGGNGEARCRQAAEMVSRSNAICSSHATCGMNQCLSFKGNTIVNGEWGGGIQQPAEATVTGSVSLSLSTPEYSGKQDRDSRKDQEVRPSPWTPESNAEGAKHEPQRTKTLLTSGTCFTWMHAYS